MFHSTTMFPTYFDLIALNRQVKVLAQKECSLVFPRVPLLRLTGPLAIIQVCTPSCVSKLPDVSHLCHMVKRSRLSWYLQTMCLQNIKHWRPCLASWDSALEPHQLPITRLHASGQTETRGWAWSSRMDTKRIIKINWGWGGGGTR